MGKWNQRTRDTILARIRSGAPDSDAAQSAGVHRATFYRWLKAKPAFKRAVDLAKSEGMVAHVGNIMKHAFGSPAEYDDKGNLIKAEVRPIWQASAWWLERRHPEHFGRHDQLRVSKDEGTVFRAFYDDGAEFGGGEEPDTAASEAVSTSLRSGPH
jgi:hypothetical protein